MRRKKKGERRKELRAEALAEDKTCEKEGMKTVIIHDESGFILRNLEES